MTMLSLSISWLISVPGRIILNKKKLRETTEHECDANAPTKPALNACDHANDRVMLKDRAYIFPESL